MSQAKGTSRELLQQLLESIDTGHAASLGDDVARLEVHHNKVLGSHLVPGLNVEVDEQENGIAARISVDAGARIMKPVHICFGMIPEEGLQQIDLEVETGAESYASILAHCTFPNAVNVEHRMDARLKVGPGSTYSYFERHIHGREGGVLVLPRARVDVAEGGRFKTEFELVKGRVGVIDIEYLTECAREAVVEMVARIQGRGDDRIKIHEEARLVGAASRAALTSHIAVRDTAHAEILNTLVATGTRARGHVDCKEIVQDHAVARAVPIVEVREPSAHVTHEAAIGSVDSKQLETLLARGLDEDAAVDLIIEGMLSP